jgi:hypothetical protein
MITARTTPLKEIPAPAAAAAIPGDWPGPAYNDFQNLTQIVVAG